MKSEEFSLNELCPSFQWAPLSLPLAPTLPPTLNVLFGNNRSYCYKQPNTTALQYSWFSVFHPVTFMWGRNSFRNKDHSIVLHIQMFLFFFNVNEHPINVNERRVFNKHHSLSYQNRISAQGDYCFDSVRLARSYFQNICWFRKRYSSVAINVAGK